MTERRSGGTRPHALHRRLAHLEDLRQKANEVMEHQACQASMEAVRKRIRLFIEWRGVERNPVESLMEAWARSLGITCPELRNLVAQGVDPILRFLGEA